MAFKACISILLLSFLFTVNQAVAETKGASFSSWDGQYIGFTIGASKG